jgi:hypothetical protein
MGLVIKLLKVGLVGKTFQLTYAVDVRSMKALVVELVDFIVGSFARVVVGLVFL